MADAEALTCCSWARSTCITASSGRPFHSSRKAGRLPAGRGGRWPQWSWHLSPRGALLPAPSKSCYVRSDVGRAFKSILIDASSSWRAGERGSPLVRAGSSIRLARQCHNSKDEHWMVQQQCLPFPVEPNGHGAEEMPNPTDTTH
jgi:hypothetical protein